MSNLTFKKTVLLSTILSTSGMALAGQALAQAQPGNALEEIVVTARKTSEKLQTTPVAVTALTPQALERKQIATVTELGRSTPNLSFAGAGVGSALIMTMGLRGQSASNAGSSNDSPVATYIDGVYQARMIGGNSSLIDMAGAEVLRGPQGTLFGRNTTGGAVNLTTKAPSNRYEGYVKVGIGNYDEREVESVVNVPLNDDVATRFVARYDEHSGYVNNANTGKKEQDVNGNYYARASVKWTPSDKPFTLRVTGDYIHYNDNGTPAVLTAYQPNAPLSFVFPAIFASVPNLGQYVSNTGNYHTSYSGVTGAGSSTNLNGLPVNTGATGNPEIDNPHNRVLSKGVNAVLDWDMGEVQLKSITAYRDSDTANSWDLDGTPVNLYEFASQYIDKQFSQEFDLSGKIDKLDWVTGLYYFRESGNERSDSWQFVQFSRDYTTFRSTSAGAFAQLNYHITKKLRATAGFRYTWDTRDANRQGTSGGAVYQGAGYLASCAVGESLGASGPYGQPLTALPAGCHDSRSSSFQYPAWIASLDYQVTDDVFTYLKTSGASLAGGVNFRAVVPGDEKFSPEHVKDVEAGLKADLFDKKVRTNTAIFYMWRNGVQSNVNGNVPIPTAPGFRNSQFQINAGKAKMYGAEFEATVLPWQGLEINGNIAYLHAKYVAGSFLTANAAGVANALDRSSEWLIQAPQWTWSIGATQGFNVPWGKISAHADYSYVAEQALYQNSLDPTSFDLNTQAVVDAANNLGRTPGYGLLNARLAFNLDSPDLEIAFWGRNLTNEKYLLNVFTGFFSQAGVATGNVGFPRTYGVTVAYHW